MALYPAAEILAAGDADRVRVELLGPRGRRTVLHDQFEGLRVDIYSGKLAFEVHCCKKHFISYE